MLLAILLIASTSQSTMVEARLRHHRNGQFVDRVIAIAALEQSSSSLPTSTSNTATPSFGFDILDAATTASSITSSASLSLSSLSSSNCTTMSICIDAITCSIRYGACYDKNYCDGNTSPYPIPTCDPSPANGLTSNKVGAGGQREDPDIAGEVIVKNLTNNGVAAD